MAINISKSRQDFTAVRVISQVDDAIDQEASDYEAYKDTLDESKLHFVDGKSPTVFICNFKFDAKTSARVNNAMLSRQSEDGKPALAFGSWSQTIAKVSLKDIQNPSDQPPDEQLRLKRDVNGYVHDDLLSQLEQLGIVDDIFNAYLFSQKKSKSPADSKNS